MKKEKEYIVQFTFPTSPATFLNVKNEVKSGFVRRVTVPYKRKNFEALERAIKSIPKSMAIRKVMLSSVAIRAICDYLTVGDVLTKNKKCLVTLNDGIKIIEDRLSTFSGGVKKHFKNSKVKIECNDLRCVSSSNDECDLGNLIFEVNVMGLEDLRVSALPTDVPESYIASATWDATVGNFSAEDIKAINNMTFDGSREFFHSRIQQNIKEAEEKYKKEKERDRKHGIKFMTREEFAKEFNINGVSNVESKDET